MNRYYVLGDVHGDYRRIRDWYKYHIAKTLRDTDHIILILLGDVGANYFFTNRDKEFKKDLGKLKQITYFCIRGNHEERPSNLWRGDPDHWHTEEFEHGMVYVENEFPYIKYATDGAWDYIINDKWHTLVLPGAYSVDKYHRLANGWSWFSGEQMTEQEMENARRMFSNRDFDLVLSHTCPIIYEPTDLFLSVVDQSTVDKTMERFLGEMEYTLNYQLWMWGHYHQTRIYPSVEYRDKVMLFDDYAFDLNFYFENRGRRPIRDSFVPTFKMDGHIVDLNRED